MDRSRRRAIRSTSAQAASNSSSAELSMRCSKAARMSSFTSPLTAMMKGKPNFLI